MMLTGLLTIAAFLIFWANLRRWRLRKHLENNNGNWHLWLSCGLILSALLCMFFGRRVQKESPPCIVFLLDCSESMRAQGREGTRLEEGKSVIARMAKAFYECEVALVTYAGSAFVDCPPTLDHAAFDTALQSAGPGKLYLPGSAPEQAIRQGEQLEAAALVLVSDGEMNPPDASSQVIWQGRRLPLTAVCCGEIGVPKEIPHGSGVFFDEATGRPALSIPTTDNILHAAALSPAPFEGVSEATNQELPMAFLRQYVGNGKNRNEFLLLFAIILLFLSLCVEPIVKRFLCGIILLFLCAVGEAAEFGTRPPSPTNDVLEGMRAELRQTRLSPAVRARLYSNLSALLCERAQLEPEQAGRFASEAVFAAQAALKLDPGLKAAASNLELAQRLLLQDGSSAGMPQSDDRQKSGEEQTQASSGNANGQEQADDKQDRSFGSWRELQEAKARRQLRAAPQGVKPW
ncbi:MAG: VWA domain-containing protein [Victivallales bacterium]|nr:VWA domain-containing protein [Victivallales bacterium]